MDGVEGAVLTERQRYWLEQIKAYAALGKSVAAYEAEHGCDARALYGQRTGATQSVAKRVFILNDTAQTF